MSSGKLFIHSFTGRSTEELAALSETHYHSREISDTEYLNWEYFNNPFGDAVISVAEENGKLVSQYIVLPREYTINNSIVKGSLSVNTLTHHDYRGRDLLNKLATETFSNCKERGIEFTIGFPNAVSFPVIRRKKIFETGGSLPLMVKPLSLLGTFKKYFSSEKIRTGIEIDLNFHIDGVLSETGISMFDADKDALKYSTFIEKFNRLKKITTHRSGIFLKWRYKQIPGRKYYFLKQEEGGSIQSVAVIRAREIFGIRCCIVVDLFSIADATITCKLASAINQIARKNHLDLLISSVSNNSNEQRALKKAGYFSIPAFFLPQKLVFIYRCHDDKRRKEVSDFNKWFLTFGDYDIF